MLKKGVYTAKCPTCGRTVVMHLLSDGAIRPNECAECGAEFEDLDNGEQRNTFVIVPKTEQSKTVVNQGADEEEPSTQGGFASGGKKRKLTVKTQKESFKVWKDK